MAGRDGASARGGAAGRAPARATRRPQRPRERPSGIVDLVAVRGQVRDLLTPVVAAAGYDLEDLSILRMGRRYVVRAVVDGDSGVDLDVVADLSREMSAALDAREQAAGEIFAGEYVLEVSSPGVDRPLTLPRHWRRNVGRLVQVTVAGTRLVGRVVSVTDDEVTMEVAAGARAFRLSEVGPGHVQVEFAHLDDLGDDEADSDDDPGDDESDDEELDDREEDE